jgi:2-aminoadipate transaminase
MAEAIHRYFPSDARFQLPDGGLSIWVSLPRNYMTEDLLRLASERGVQFLPGSAFYFRSPLSNSLRLSFSSEPEDRIEKGIRILGSLLHSERPRLASRPDHADMAIV